MKALLCKDWGGPDDLVLEDIELPPPGPGEVIIDVHAAGLNFPDLLLIAGKYQARPAFPFSPGQEVGGVVSAIGDGVTRVAPGDRVMATTGGNGGFAEQVCTLEQKVYPIPETVSFKTAAAIPTTYGTTYNALKDRANLQPGETLLVHGASGGVGLNAVELGKLMGARVIGTVGSDEKMEIVRRYGADEVFNHSMQSVKDTVNGLTDGRGADVIYDPVGGDAFDQSLRCINWDGRLLVVGFASGRIPEAKANLMLLKHCQVVGVFYGAWANRFPDRARAEFETLLNWCDEGKINPHICAEFDLGDAAEGMKMLADRKATGKIIINPR